MRLVPATACFVVIFAIALAVCPQTARAGKAVSESAVAKTLSPAAAAKRGAAAPTAGFGEVEAAQVADPAQRQELIQISQEFAATVTAKTLARFGHNADHRQLELIVAPGQAYRNAVRADALGKLKDAGADLSFSQYFVYADRNPGAQLLILAFYDAASQHVVLLGADFISSGKLRPGEDSFITPLGVFENLPDNWGYRAQGSKNSKGWRGLGARGSRVWDFGYQQAPRQFRQGVYDSQMRLLMHATDPDHGEQRLGGPDSKGCVRVSAAANAFLDRRSILDRHYEQIARTDKERDMWLLRPDRAPVSLPGSYLVVGDSAQGSAAR
ncbi:MAG: hypothetical protein ACLGQH_01330 [Acidobacteriota bacterium]